MSNDLKIIVCILLGTAFMSMLFVMWLISFRLPDHLKSSSYKAIFISKLCWAILCGAGIYLIIWPLPQRIPLVTVLWFSLLAIGCIHSAIGFYLYSRDVNAVLLSDDFQATLPAKPPDIPNGTSVIHKNKTGDKGNGGEK